MKANLKKGALAAASLAVLLALGACGDRAEDEMPLPDQASVETNRQGMEGAKDESAAQGVANDTASMGAAPGASTEADPDVKIATDVQAALASNPDFGAVKVDVHSNDGAITLRGTAPDPAAKDRATEIARSVSGVKSVDNQLTLG